MNLQENIHRIKEMMGIIREQSVRYIDDNPELSYKPERVLTLQEIREMTHNFLHDYGFKKVKTLNNGEREVFSNGDDTYNILIDLSIYYRPNRNNHLWGRIIYTGPKKESPKESPYDIAAMKILTRGGNVIHNNNYGFPYELDYIVRYVKSIKFNAEIEPYSEDIKDKWNSTI